MHPLTACPGRRCTEQRGRKAWMAGEGGCNPIRKSRALCEANRFFHNAQCVAVPRSRPAMVDLGYVHHRLRQAATLRRPCACSRLCVIACSRQTDRTAAIP